MEAGLMKVLSWSDETIFIKQRLDEKNTVQIEAAAIK